MKISLRLGIVISVVVLATALIIALVMSSWFYASAVEERKKWTASLTKTIAATIARDTLEDRKSKVRALLLDIQKQNPDIVYAYITDFDGKPYVATATPGSEYSRQIMVGVDADHENESDYQAHGYEDNIIIDVGYPLIENLPAHIHIGFSKSSVNGFIDKATDEALLIILLVLFFAMIISSFLARKLSLPITGLARYVDAYGRGNIIKEGFAVMGDGKDEIGQLYKSFKEMIKQRAWYESELHEHRNNLEVLVKQRTDELENVIHAHELTEVSLLEAKNIAEQASRAKTEFMSNMSHELRTPLNAVLGFAQLIKTEDIDNKVVSLGVDQILVASNHLLGLINDILDLSGIEAGNIQMDMESVNLNALLAECLDMIAVSSKIALPRFIQELKTDNNFILADKMRIKQVVTNLLTNAVKYNKDEGDIQIAIKSSDKNICLYVTDNGLGIPDSFKPQVFMPFTRLDKYVAVVEGTGIGLAISKRLVERMSGSIGFTSVEGEGSEFWICMPRADTDVITTSVTSLSDAESLMQKLPERTFSVLYIEDNPASMLLTRKLLEKYQNIEFLSASDPLAGIAMAKARIPDLIFLDINMPRLNGYEVKERLDACNETRGIPVIAISANAQKDDIDKALKLGFERYLTKPVDIKIFYQVTFEYLAAVSSPS